MKKYIMPEIDVIEFEFADVLSSSTIPSIPEDDNDVVWGED